MQLVRALCASIALFTLTPLARAGDRYAVVSLAELELTAGSLPAPGSSNWAHFARVEATRPYGRLDGEGELVLGAPRDGTLSTRSSDASVFTLALRVPEGLAGEQVSGRLYVAEPDASSMRRLEFVVPASAFQAEREDFLEIQLGHYEHLLERRSVGAAWFRHRARALRAELDERIAAEPEGARALAGTRPRRGDVDDTWELFTGGRAVAENLQLERELVSGDADEEEVDLSGLAGVQTAAYDWSAEIEGLEPARDPLARWIPADQHAVFATSFERFVQTVDEAKREGSPLVRLVERRAEDAGTRERYETQLCLPLDERTRALGPLVVRSLALTGGDPYLRTGSDVAVLFESPTPQVLETFLLAEHQRALEADSAVRREEGELDGWSYRGVRSPDRRVCSYVARVADGVLVVTNSLAQLERLAPLREDAGLSLDALDEYTFFRARYPRDDADEALLVVISDATLRRWTGPRWRIGAARRTRAAALLAEGQASWMAASLGLSGADLDDPLFADTPLTSGPQGTWSERWGSTAFLTPIAELDLERVTQSEAKAYERFRVRYQRGWRAWFDPIALSISRPGGDLGLDLTVRPLIAGSDYREWMEIIGEGTLAPLAGDPRSGTLVQFAMAVDPDSGPFDMARGLLGGGRGPGAPSLFGWVGDGVSLTVEADPVLDEWRAAAAEDDADVWLEDNMARLPVVLQVESKDPLRLAGFLVALRGLVDQSAPALTEWSNHEHAGVTYVRIGASESARGNLGAAAQVALWYAALPDAWILTLREDLLQQAIDRHGRRGSEEEPQPTPWRGSSMALRVDEAVLDLLEEIDGENDLIEQQRIAWSALPLLREWRALAPGRDALELHRQLFGSLPLEPAGGSYVWDPQWDTYVSSVYGHPGAPLQGPTWPAAFEALRSVDFGVTFEADGLRARALLQRD